MTKKNNQENRYAWKCRISKNFDESEFSCCCCGKNKVAGELVAKLQELRDIINKPIHITSGYRCKRENKKVGGSVHSAHLLGEGADIQTELSTITLAMIACKIDGIRIGIYPNHIHIDVRPANPSKYWLVKKYNQAPIYSKRENNLAKFLKNNL